MFLPLCFLAAALCRVQTLATGLVADLPSSAQVELRGNQFIDCERGVELGTRAVAGTVAPVLYSTCNTFQRDAQRDGTAFGFFLQNPPGSSPPLVFDDFTVPTPGTTVLKDLFDPAGHPPGEYWAFWNQTSNPVDYLTFKAQATSGLPTYYGLYASGPSAVNFGNGGPIDLSQRPNPMLQPCALDGFPDTGIQQRGITGTGTSIASITMLAQNVPNPCVGSTRFDLRLPRTAHGAALLIRHGLDGRPVAELPFKPTATYLDVDLRGYTPGTYFCTLVVDGMPVQTKRMLVE